MHAPRNLGTQPAPCILHPAPCAAHHALRAVPCCIFASLHHAPCNAQRCTMPHTVRRAPCTAQWR
eukprot:5358676-Lingulodinium_polyedra.AAC.1